MRLNRQSTALKTIFRHLATCNISVNHFRTNRSGYRYSTLDMYISFDELRNSVSELNFDSTSSYYKETFENTINLTADLRKLFSTEIFEDKNDKDLENGINPTVNTALHYFHFKTSQNLYKNNFYKPFTLRYNKGVLTTNSGGKINSIIKNLEKSEFNTDIPSLLFISGDSDYLNFRSAIIPSNKVKNFCKVTLYYERINNNYSSRGLLMDVLEAIPNSYKVWSSMSSLFECRKEFGAGEILVYVENTNRTNPNSFRSLKNALKRLEKKYQTKRNQRLKENIYLNGIFIDSKITPIFPDLMHKFYLKNFKNNNPEFIYDVFISHSAKDKPIMERMINIFNQYNVKYFLSGPMHIEAGEDLFNTIKNALKNSREFCLFITKEHLSSTWITTEWGAAWFNGMQITVITPSMTDAKLKKHDKRLTTGYNHYFYNDKQIEAYAKKLILNRYDYAFKYGKGTQGHAQ